MSVVNVFSPTWDNCSSYGIVATNFELQLEKAGMLVQRFGGEAEAGATRAISIRMGGFIFGYPTLKMPAMLKSGKRVAITMFESSKIPDEWVDPLNECDVVIVPADFLVAVFKDCGVTSRIEVVPLGISDAYTYVERKTPAITEEDPFTFLCFGDRGDRKGWREALSAFVDAFGDDTRYKMILKSRNPGNMPVRFTNPNIEVVYGDMSAEELAALYSRCHAMVFSTKGEGFGLPPREFAGTGGLVLTTNWGGTADQLEQWGLPIPFTMKPAWSLDKGWEGKYGQWAEPFMPSMAALMKHVASHYDTYADFRKRAAGFVQSQYRWDLFTQRVLQIWQDVSKGNGNGDYTNSKPAGKPSPEVSVN